MTTVDKAIVVLQRLATDGPRMPLARLQETTQIPKPTLYRMLRSMMSHGLVRQDSAGTYSVGSHVYEIARDVYRHVALPDEARQILIDLQAEAPETLHISSFRHGQLVYVEKLEAPHPYQMASRVGKLQMLHSSAIGKAVLSRLPLVEAKELLDRVELPAITTETIVDPQSLLGLLPEIAEQGYALDDEEDEEGLIAIGSAICDEVGSPIGGISIVAPTFHMTATQAQSYVPALLRAARRLEDALAR
jgi:IclR family acetate operon transcriptional repressor